MSLRKRALDASLGAILTVAAFLSAGLASADERWIVFDGGPGIGAGKHVVLVSGDEEYRSEEAMPMLAKILSRRFGFRCTVLFAIHPESGEIDPNVTDNIPGLSALKTADLMVVFTRFRTLPDEQMKHVDAYMQTGRPVIGIRPSVVAFRNAADARYAKYSSDYRGEDFPSGFGRQVLGATWISHHGHHGKESTRGLPVEAMRDHPILRGVGTMWGPTDVYTVRTPIPHDGQVLVMGQVLQGMHAHAEPSPKPQMPLAWIKRFPTPAGDARVFMSTMGDARDFEDENFRRMIVNACFWTMGLEEAIAEETDVATIVPFSPPSFGFNGFRKGLFPRDYAHIEAAPPSQDRAATPFAIREGDRICYIGNTLADRMQHFGWLETLVQDRFRRHNLVFRNLGFSADELTVRPRSMNFGDPHAHLTHSAADVVFAFFGYNESFGGRPGLDRFRRDLKRFIADTREHQYNGSSPPRIVLFSPIAHEDMGDRNLPDGRENNQRLSMYSAAMAEVARDEGVAFVDLFQPTRELYESTEDALTINGIHLNDQGYRLVAQVIDEALFGAPPTRSEPELERLREAVLTKNLRWFNRYRATDGYSTYGQRSTLAFVDGQTNYEVMQQELRMLDVMTANRDRGIWAVAQGREAEVDDSIVPSPIPVKTNKPGPGPEGEHAYLTGEEAIGKMKIASNMTVNLFASDDEFPELVNPVQMAADADGRLWVAAWHTYPHWHPNEPLDDKLLIFPDDDRDGRADRCVVFADGLHNPTGFEFWNGGVLVACAPDILFLQDTDGDDRADVTVRYLHGIDSADTHCSANSFVLGPDGNIYFSEGIFHYTNIETPWGRPLRTVAPMLYRWNPRTGRIADHFYVTPNPHGIAIDSWGYLFATDATTGRGYYVGYPGAGTPHELYRMRVRPVAGFGMLSGTHFPPESRGNLLICNTIGFLGVLQHRVTVSGADFTSEEIEPVVVSSDPNFRPVDVEIGGDGALYVLDWQNTIIGHMQHNIRDPSRDHTHGRIYRFTVPGRALADSVELKGRPIAEVVGHLASPEDAVRYRARIVLSGRPGQKVVAAAKTWAATFDPTDVEDAHHLLEALWLHEQHDIVDQELLALLLRSPHPKARAAATRVLGHWGTRVEDALPLLLQQARDDEALVRAEAVVAAASFEGIGAAEVVFEAQARPLDAQLEYAIGQTRRSVDKFWQQAIREGRSLSAAGIEFVLREGGNPDLLSLPRTEPVCRAILARSGIAPDERGAALAQLADLTGEGMGSLLLEQIELQARSRSAVHLELIPLLRTLPSSELAEIEPLLARIARSDGHGVLRSSAIAALIDSGRRIEDVLETAARDHAGALAFLNSVALVQDASKRSAMYGSVRPLLFDTPDRWKAKDGEPSSGGARYLRVELSRKSILTLAEALVLVDGVNVATQGVATQSGIDSGGAADRAIDGNTDGNWSAGSCTATANRQDPWWEVDLGNEYPVDRVILHNRIDCCTERLNDFTLTLLDTERRPVFVREHVARPDPRADIAVTGVGDGGLAGAALRALGHIPGHDAAIFADMATLVRAGGKHCASAIGVMLAVPSERRPEEGSRPLAECLVAYIGAIPAERRTGGPAQSAMTLAEQLTAGMPVAEAAPIRAGLNALRVRVLELGTVPQRMIYDQPILVVEAGKPMELRFSNADDMPHNFALLLPGSLEEVGLLAEATSTAPDVGARHYIPESDKIIVASRLLEPGAAQVLNFDAPATSGVYPYVCTYPGHWRRMYGALYVVDDLDAYEADPSGYLAGNPLPLLDPLLEYSGQDVEWQFDDLSASLRPLPHGRSFDVGRTAFTIASCVSCHQMNGEGKEFGPDLSKLDTEKFTPEEILRAILEPSVEINEEYQTTKFLLHSGELVTGIVVGESSTMIEVVTDPLASTVPIVVEEEEIDQRAQSSLSIMPEGLLGKLTREEILDLIAYVYSGGDEGSMLFSAGHGR